MNNTAKVFYVVGASGVGKDSILSSYKQSALYLKDNIIIAHRYITRQLTSTTQAENFISLSNTEFNFRNSNNLFSLTWSANNCSYGIGLEMNTWLSSGLSVILNGSRSYLPEAKKKYPQNLVSITVDVPDDILRDRLIKRKRESLTDIDARIDRHKQLKHIYKTDEIIINDTTIDNAVDCLARVVSKYKKSDNK